MDPQRDDIMLCCRLFYCMEEKRDAARVPWVIT